MVRLAARIVPCCSLLLITRGPLAAQSAPVLPDAVNKPTLNYVPTLRGAVLFGGYSQTGALDQTWLLREGCWQQLPVSGPKARGAHAAAYDPARQQLVLFGGSDASNAALGDTWVFDGSRWQERKVAGPPPRSTHRMTYDAVHRRILLVGGRNSVTGAPYDDTWSWDGTQWRAIARGAPPARVESALSFHAAGGYSVLFGGSRTATAEVTGGPLADTWVLRGSEWKPITGSGPGPRDHHAMTYHEARGVTVLFGGFHERMLADTWLFDGTRWQLQANSESPAARGGVPAMTYDSDRGRVLMYGGWGDSGALRDLWEWDGRWSRATACRSAGGPQ